VKISELFLIKKHVNNEASYVGALSAMSQKMGFGAVLALVFGSQIGAGIFVLPAELAPFGMFGVYGWGLAGAGAMLLAFMFAELCSKFPKTGGPYTYVQQVFGRKAGFFTGWTYWLVSWIGTSISVIAAIANLGVFLGDGASPYLYLFWEVVLLIIISAINCISVNFAGRLESFLGLFKLIPLVVVPAILLCHFDANNISIAPQYANLSTVQLGLMVTMIACWGFVGVESATTPAGAVENPSKTIPRAIIIGTFGVVLAYVLSSLSVMGVIPSETLISSKSPYGDAVNLVLGGHVSKIISVVISIIMVSASNSWTLAAAQVSLGLAREGLMPSCFAKTNKNLAPYVGILVSNVGILMILIFSINSNVSRQLFDIINFSVGVYLMVYTMCSLAFIKICKDSKEILKMILGIMALLFCVTIILNSSTESMIVSLLFVASGMLILPFTKLNAVCKF